jgi:ADP-ribose pyrophosphatase
LGARFGNINFKLIGGWSKMGYAREEIQEINPWVSLIKRYMPGIASPYVHLRTNDYVSIIALDNDKGIALVSQYRPALDRTTLELPGGNIDYGQTIEEAARTELMEETGLYFESIIKILPHHFIDSARLESRNFTVIVEVNSAVGIQPTEHGISVKWVETKELHEMLKNSDIALASHNAAIAESLLFGYIS